jgi:hypothetical protein
MPVVERVVLPLDPLLERLILLRFVFSPRQKLDVGDLVSPVFELFRFFDINTLLDQVLPG